jgi:iron complex outermembrane recepter protein
MIKSWAMTGAAALALCAAPAWAQTTNPAPVAEPAGTAQDDAQAADEPRAPGDIIVTAQRRSERLQDVPVAVSVVTGDLLTQQGGVNLENAQYLVPTLNFRKSGIALNQSLYLRGIGTTTFSIGGEPSVGTVLDGVVLARAGEAFTDLVDIDRIEVLRGPQGTLFGKNASAGVVNIISRRPGDDFGGFVEAGFFSGNGDEYRVRGALDLPLAEGLAARVTGFYSEWQGNIFNDAPGVNRRVNGYQRYGFRGIVEAKPSSTVTLTLIGDWRKSDDDCCGEVIGAPALNADGTPSQTFLTRAAVALPPVRGDETRTLRQNLITRALEESWGVSFQADVELDGPTVSSITAYRRYDANEIRDGDFLDRPYVGGAGFLQSHDFGPQTSNTFSQELRITSPGQQFFDYTAGLFYYRAEAEREFTRANINCSASTLAPIAPGLTPCSTAPGVSTFTLPISTANFGTVFKNIAVFGQGTLNFTPQLRAIVGLRYTFDQLDGFHIRRVFVPGASNPAFDQGVFDSVSPAFPNGNPAAANGIPFRQKTTADNLSGRAGLQYDFSDDVMGYATYARGYKGPGVNIFFNLNANGTPPLAPETADSYEAGLKTTLFNGLLTLNIAGYYAKYNNFQANNPDFVLGQRVTRFSNAGTISTRGIEVDFFARPARDLNLSGGVAFTDAKVDQFRLPPGANPADAIPDGTRLPFAPEWKASLAADYTVRTGGFADIRFGVQSAYQSEQTTLFVGNVLARNQSVVDGYALVDLSLALVDPEDRFRITATVRNLFDTSFAAAISDGNVLGAGAGTNAFRYLIPREADRFYGVTARVNF